MLNYCFSVVYRGHYESVIMRECCFLSSQCCSDMCESLCHVSVCVERPELGKMGGSLDEKPEGGLSGKTWENNLKAGWRHEYRPVLWRWGWPWWQRESDCLSSLPECNSARCLWSQFTCQRAAVQLLDISLANTDYTHNVTTSGWGLFQSLSCESLVFHMLNVKTIWIVYEFFLFKPHLPTYDTDIFTCDSLKFKCEKCACVMWIFLREMSKCHLYLYVN